MSQLPNFSQILTPRGWQQTQRRVADLLPRGARVLVAVSGGADSLALLQVLRACECGVVVAHIDHQTRDGQSAHDAAFVANLCAQLSMRCRVERVQVLAGGGVSFEMAARKSRYEALEMIAREAACSHLATGHTGDDQLETVLLHWLRGAAIDGLRGIEPTRDLNQALILVRPILGLTRRETEAICAASGFAAREDASNADGQYLRNRVRGELVPLLAELMNESGARERLVRQTLRATEILRDDLELLDEIARREVENLTLKRAENLLVLDGVRWRALPLAMQRRSLRWAAKTVLRDSGLAGEISSRKIEDARHWIVENRRRAVWMWTRDLRVEWTGASSGNRVRLTVV